MDVKEMRCKVVDPVHMVQDRNLQNLLHSALKCVSCKICEISLLAGEILAFPDELCSMERAIVSITVNTHKAHRLTVYSTQVSS
jgi:hypothetical protein